jgi:hypothetical protein
MLLSCDAVRVSGLPATFTHAPSPTVPSVTASVAVFPRPSSSPRGARLVTSHKGPASVPQVVSQVLDSINIITACKCRVTAILSHLPFRPATSFPSPSHAVYADVYRLLPLSLLPCKKKKIGNLQSHNLALRYHHAGNHSRGHGQSYKPKQCACPLITEIFTELVTAISIELRSLRAYCYTVARRTAMTIPLADILNHRIDTTICGMS